MRPARAVVATRARAATSTSPVEGEIGVFVPDRALITVRKGDLLDIDQVVARRDGSQELVDHGVPFLLYGLLDSIVDRHLTAVEDLDEAIEDLEALLLDDRCQHVELAQQRSFELRKSFVLHRRVVLPMREVANAVLRRDLNVVGEAMAPSRPAASRASPASSPWPSGGGTACDRQDVRALGRFQPRPAYSVKVQRPSEMTTSPASFSVT